MDTQEHAPGRPLVVMVGAGAIVWIEDGRGWIRSASGGARWEPLGEAPGLGGRVLTAAEVEVLAAGAGLPPRCPAGERPFPSRQNTGAR